MDIATILSISLSAFVSFITVVSSVVTIVINNKHQRKLKLFENKIEKYKIFISLYADFEKTTKEENADVSVFSKSIIDCLLFANKETFFLLNKLRKSLKGFPKHLKAIFDSPIQLYQDCIVSMNKELSQKY